MVPRPKFPTLPGLIAITLTAPNFVIVGKRNHDRATSKGKLLCHCQSGDTRCWHVSKWHNKHSLCSPMVLPTFLVHDILSIYRWKSLTLTWRTLLSRYAQQEVLIEWVHEGDFFRSLSPHVWRKRPRRKSPQEVLVEKRSIRSRGHQVLRHRLAIFHQWLQYYVQKH